MNNYNYGDMNLEIMVCPKCKQMDTSLDIETNKLICNNPKCGYMGKDKEMRNAQDFKQEQLDIDMEKYNEAIQRGEVLNFPDVNLQSKPT